MADTYIIAYRLKDGTPEWQPLYDQRTGNNNIQQFDNWSDANLMAQSIVQKNNKLITCLFGVDYLIWRALQQLWVEES